MENENNICAEEIKYNDMEKANGTETIQKVAQKFDYIERKLRTKQKISSSSSE